MSRRHIVATTIATLALAPLAECTQDVPPQAAPTSKTTTPPTAPTPTVDPDAPRVSIGPGETVPLPGKGAEPEDVIRQWLAGLNELQVTGASRTFTALSTASCEYCSEFDQDVADVYAAGGRVESGPPTLTSITTTDHQGLFVYVLKYNATPMKVWETDKAAPMSFPGGPAELLLGLEPTVDGWLVNSVTRRPR